MLLEAGPDYPVCGELLISPRISNSPHTGQMIAAGCASRTSMSVPIEPTPGACRVEEARPDYGFPIVPVSVKVTTEPSALIAAPVSPEPLSLANFLVPPVTMKLPLKFSPPVESGGTAQRRPS